MYAAHACSFNYKSDSKLLPIGSNSAYGHNFSGLKETLIPIPAYNNDNNDKYIYKGQKTKGFYALYMVKLNVQYKIHTFILYNNIFLELTVFLLPINCHSCNLKFN